MKKTLLLLAFFGLVSIQIFGQHMSYKLTEGQLQQDKLSQRTLSVEFLGSDDDSFYYLYLPYEAVYGQKSIGSVSDHFIAKFDKESVKQITKRQIELTDDKNFQGIYNVNDELFLYSSFCNKKHKKSYLFVQNINKESLQLQDNVRKIAEIDHSDVKKFYQSVFYHEISPDSSKILIYSTVVNRDYKVVKYGLYVFNNNMELLWSKENLRPDIKKGLFVNEDLQVDNNGNVYMKGSNYLDEKAYEESISLGMASTLTGSPSYWANLPNYVTQIYKYSESSDEATYVTLNLPDLFIHSLTYKPLDNGKILCAGIYASEGMISPQGSFVFTLDIETNDVSDFETEDFEPGLVIVDLKENLVKKYGKKLKNENEWNPFQYKLSDIKIDDNGKYYFIAEQYLRGYVKENGTGNSIITKILYHHNNLLVTRFGKDYSINSIDAVQKSQAMVVSRRFNSYGLFEKDGTLYFIFTENYKVISPITHINFGPSYLVKLDEEGNVEKEELNLSEKKHLIIAKSAAQITGDKFIFTSTRYSAKNYRTSQIDIAE